MTVQARDAANALANRDGCTTGGARHGRPVLRRGQYRCHGHAGADRRPGDGSVESPLMFVVAAVASGDRPRSPRWKEIWDADPELARARLVGLARKFVGGQPPLSC